MNIENPVLLLLFILFVFLCTFLLEAAVLYYLKLKNFWPAFGICLLLNLISLVLIYFLAAVFVSALGYNVADFNGFALQPQVIAFFWWFSVIAEGLLLQLFLRNVEKKKIFTASLVMNILSFVFFFGLIELSH